MLPRLGATSLQELTAADLNQLYDQLETGGGRQGQALSAKTVLNVHRVVHKALADAVCAGKPPFNPADRVQTPSAPKARTEVWSVEKLRGFLEHGASATTRSGFSWPPPACAAAKPSDSPGPTWTSTGGACGSP